jgi:hypothetical protein
MPSIEINQIYPYHMKWNENGETDVPCECKTTVSRTDFRCLKCAWYQSLYDDVKNGLRCAYCKAYVYVEDVVRNTIYCCPENPNYPSFCSEICETEGQSDVIQRLARGRI